MEDFRINTSLIQGRPKAEMKNRVELVSKIIRDFQGNSYTLPQDCIGAYVEQTIFKGDIIDKLRNLLDIQISYKEGSNYYVENLINEIHTDSCNNIIFEISKRLAESMQHGSDYRNQIIISLTCKHSTMRVYKFLTKYLFNTESTELVMKISDVYEECKLVFSSNPRMGDTLLQKSLSEIEEKLGIKVTCEKKKLDVKLRTYSHLHFKLI